MIDSNPATPIERLLSVMARLRDPNTGCPWDKEQTFKTIAPYTIEEAYEVADAIEQGDMEALKDELGDLLFQVVFYAQMSRETGGFDFDAIATAISDKMERRHPHVFGDVRIRDEAQQRVAWEAQKASERASQGTEDRPASALDGVARALPALMRAEKLQKRAARVGFDWPEIGPVYDKVEEEIAELKDARTREEIEEEVGDLIFAVVNVARHMEVDPEVALRRGNDKFEKRFRQVEKHLTADGKQASDCSIDELEEIWSRVKKSVG
ncbi:MAG: nucleoside triphosphate pyrophosphohydrolase [Proteobacteria bacterium]|nr:nucleoside triphosphate pyrophosphohydrolase [Pseudomonadota bacterium]